MQDIINIKQYVFFRLNLYFIIYLIHIPIYEAKELALFGSLMKSTPCKVEKRTIRKLQTYKILVYKK